MTKRTSRPSRTGGRRLRTAAGVALLGAVFGVALLAPLPVAHNTAQAEVLSSVEKRLPGWSIVRTRSSWEGAWTVVAACGIQRLGFQWVPGHGLQPGEAWLHPEDSYARSRLAAVSDDYRYLVWLGDPVRQHTLSCQQEMARIHAGRIGGYLD